MAQEQKSHQFWLCCRHLLWKKNWVDFQLHKDSKKCLCQLHLTCLLVVWDDFFLEYQMICNNENEGFWLMSWDEGGMGGGIDGIFFSTDESRKDLEDEDVDNIVNMLCVAMITSI